jgi:hypothetical protein
LANGQFASGADKAIKQRLDPEAIEELIAFAASGCVYFAVAVAGDLWVVSGAVLVETGPTLTISIRTAK